MTVTLVYITLLFWFSVPVLITLCGSEHLGDADLIDFKCLYCLWDSVGGLG